MPSVLPTAAAAALAFMAASPTPAPSDPQAIFAAARAAWNFTSYPRYANYTVRVRYRNGGANVERTYDTLEDLRRTIVFAHDFSREETANPTYPPGGINFGMLGMTLNRPRADDPIGPVALAITYDFGISLSPQTTQIAQLGSEITAPSRYPVIGRSGISARTYDVRLVDMLDNGRTLHLALTPLRDPNRFRLREMWIDAKTFVTEQIQVAANFARKPYINVAWLVTFKQIDGGPYISEERALRPLDFGAAGTLENVTVSFENIVSTPGLPRYGTVGINEGASSFVTEP